MWFGTPPNNKIENPVANVVNHIHARIHNAGPATAFDFDVRFRVSEPYHTVGGDADFIRQTLSGRLAFRLV